MGQPNPNPPLQYLYQYEAIGSDLQYTLQGFHSSSLIFCRINIICRLYMYNSIHENYRSFYTLKFKIVGNTFASHWLLYLVRGYLFACRLTMKEDFYSFYGFVKKARLTSVSSESHSGRGWMSTFMIRWVYRT